MLLGTMVLAAAVAQPLAGPQVRESGPSSAARLRYDGTMVEPELPPPVMILGSIDLTEAECARVDALLGERAAVFDRAVTDNWEGLLSLDGFKAERNLRAQALVIAGFLSSLKPLADHPPLREQVRGALDDSHYDEFDALLVRFDHDQLASWRADAERSGEPPRLLGHAIEAAGRSFGAEVERAVERYVSDGTGLLERLLDDLDLTPEQDRIVRAIVADHMAGPGFEPDEETQKQLFLKVVTHLPPDKAARLIEILKRGF